MTYFTSVKSFDDLKNQFRTLAKKNHPDAGGDSETMKAINLEYDKLFIVWKNRAEDETKRPIYETAEGTRRKFYTQNGWAGARYDSSMSTKEICKRVREYVKETFPTYKFSVRFKTASMYSEIYVDMKESPAGVYKAYDELDGREALKPFGYSGNFSESEVWKVWRKAVTNGWVSDRGCYDESLDSELRQAYDKYNFLKVLTDEAKFVVDDVNAYVDSYRMEDCDGMSDYFDVSDYYFGVSTDDVKIVPKAARISKPKGEIASPELPENEYSVEKNGTHKNRRGNLPCESFAETHS